MDTGTAADSLHSISTGIPDQHTGPVTKAMRITEIEVFNRSLSADRTGWNPVFIRIHTDEGVTGVGEMAPSYSSSLQAAIRHLHHVGPEFIGSDPSAALARLFPKLFSFQNPSLEAGHAASALDMALVDIKARALGVPAWELFGGRVHDSVRLYANGWCYHLTEPAQYADAAASVVEAGFTAMKFDPFRYFEGGFRWDHQAPGSATRNRWLQVAVDRVAAVREAVGRDVDILLEAHGKFDPPTAIAIAEAMAGFDLYWYEEPTDSAHVGAMKQIAEHVRLPVALGERLMTRWDFFPFIDARAAAIVQPDLGMAGGLTETRKIADYAEVHKVFIAPHNCGGPVLSAAAFQLDATCRNFLIQETFPFRNADYFDYTIEPYESRFRDGYYAYDSSNAAGLGIELDDEKLKAAERTVIR